MHANNLMKCGVKTLRQTDKSDSLQRVESSMKDVVTQPT